MSNDNSELKNKFHKFSWLNEPIDISKQCVVCTITKNSPCEKQGDKLFEAVKQKRNKEEYNEFLQPVLQCIRENQEIFQARFAELSEFAASIADE